MAPRGKPDACRTLAAGGFAATGRLAALQPATLSRYVRVRPSVRFELAILRLYGEGLGTDQIAELLVLSPHTVRTHVRNAHRHLGVSSRAEALDLLKAADADPFM